MSSKMSFVRTLFSLCLVINLVSRVFGTEVTSEVARVTSDSFLESCGRDQGVKNSLKEERDVSHFQKKDVENDDGKDEYPLSAAASSDEEYVVGSEDRKQDAQQNGGSETDAKEKSEAGEVVENLFGVDKEHPEIQNIDRQHEDPDDQVERLPEQGGSQSGGLRDGATGTSKGGNGTRKDGKEGASGKDGNGGNGTGDSNDVGGKDSLDGKYDAGKDSFDEKDGGGKESSEGGGKDGFIKMDRTSPNYDPINDPDSYLTASRRLRPLRRSVRFLSHQFLSLVALLDDKLADFDLHIANTSIGKSLGFDDGKGTQPQGDHISKGTKTGSDQGKWTRTRGRKIILSTHHLWQALTALWAASFGHYCGICDDLTLSPLSTFLYPIRWLGDTMLALLPEENIENQGATETLSIYLESIIQSSNLRKVNRFLHSFARKLIKIHWRLRILSSPRNIPLWKYTDRHKDGIQPPQEFKDPYDEIRNPSDKLYGLDADGFTIIQKATDSQESDGAVLLQRRHTLLSWWREKVITGLGDVISWMSLLMVSLEVILKNIWNYFATVGAEIVAEAEMRVAREALEKNAKKEEDEGDLEDILEWMADVKTETTAADSEGPGANATKGANVNATKGADQNPTGTKPVPVIALQWFSSKVAQLLILSGEPFILVGRQVICRFRQAFQYLQQSDIGVTIHVYCKEFYRAFEQTGITLWLWNWVDSWGGNWLGAGFNAAVVYSWVHYTYEDHEVYGRGEGGNFKAAKQGGDSNGEHGEPRYSSISEACHGHVPLYSDIASALSKWASKSDIHGNCGSYTHMKSGFLDRLLHGERRSEQTSLEKTPPAEHTLMYLISILNVKKAYGLVKTFSENQYKFSSLLAFFCGIFTGIRKDNLLAFPFISVYLQDGPIKKGNLRGVSSSQTDSNTGLSIISSILFSCVQLFFYFLYILTVYLCAVVAFEYETVVLKPRTVLRTIVSGITCGYCCNYCCNDCRICTCCNCTIPGDNIILPVATLQLHARFFTLGSFCVGFCEFLHGRFKFIREHGIIGCVRTWSPMTCLSGCECHQEEQLTSSGSTGPQHSTGDVSGATNSADAASFFTHLLHVHSDLLQHVGVGHLQKESSVGKDPIVVGLSHAGGQVVVDAAGDLASVKSDIANVQPGSTVDIGKATADVGSATADPGSAIADVATAGTADTGEASAGA